MSLLHIAKQSPSAHSPFRLKVRQGTAILQSGGPSFIGSTPLTDQPPPVVKPATIRTSTKATRPSTSQSTLASTQPLPSERSPTISSKHPAKSPRYMEPLRRTAPEPSRAPAKPISREDTLAKKKTQRSAIERLSQPNERSRQEARALRERHERY